MNVILRLSATRMTPAFILGPPSPFLCLDRFICLRLIPPCGVCATNSLQPKTLESRRVDLFCILNISQGPTCELLCIRTKPWQRPRCLWGARAMRSLPQPLLSPSSSLSTLTSLPAYQVLYLLLLFLRTTLFLDNKF